MRWGAMCVTVAMLLVCGSLHAQEDTEPGAGFRGGQMVRGTVTAQSGDKLSIKTDKGDVFQVAVTPNTRMMKERQPVRIADVKVGDSVGAMGVLDAPAKTVHAMFVMVVDAEAAKKAREGMGKVYITGKVTAIDELKLTILRPDGVSQVIAVDEGTSFKRGGRNMQSMVDGNGPVDGRGSPEGGPGPVGAAAGAAGAGSGESITLADIKVGDGVAGRGELKGGIFVPTELGVMDAAMRGRRRRPEGTAAGAPPELR